MPQFEIVNFAPQFVWMVIAFAILYFGIVSLTLPKLGRTIDARDGQVKGDIATAEQAIAEADRIATVHAAGVAAAQDKARAHLDVARGKAAAALEAKLADSNALIAAKAGAAATALDTARAKAMTEIESVVSDAAADIVEKLTGARPAPDEAGAAARGIIS
jgi:F-type H+-transporting ATPase subunit b